MLLEELNGTYQIEVGIFLTSQVLSVGALCEACCSPCLPYYIHVCVQSIVRVCVGRGGTIHGLSTPQKLIVRVKGRRMQVYVHVCI